jgi:CRP-like cAMP-binding protein
MSSEQENSLLAMLPPGDLAALKDHLSTVELRQGQPLAHPGAEIRKVYFPHSGIVSFMVEVGEGGMVQTGMVGRDGVVGAVQALDNKVSLNKIIVQVAGTASVIDRDPLRHAISHGNSIRKLIVAHEQFFVADIQQTAACNALHSVEARMSRWILRMMDLVGNDIPLTQEFLASMIGVGRTSVSQVAIEMQDSDLIRYSRGQVHIESVDRLKQLSCECYRTVRQNYSSVFGILPPKSE